MTQLTDFTPEENNLLRSLPLLVSVTSLIFIQPNLSEMLDYVLSLYSIRLSKPSSLKAIHSLLLLLRPGVFKALRTVLVLGTIWDDTSKPFPVIRAMFEEDASEEPPNMEELIFFLKKKYQGSEQEKALAVRNDLCLQATAILMSENLYQEAEEYKSWLLQIARETIQRGQSSGLLRSSKNAQASRMTRYLQDFAQALQIPSEVNMAAGEQTLDHKGS